MEMSGKTIVKSEEKEVDNNNNGSSKEMYEYNKPTYPSSSIFVDLKVNNQNGNHIYFRIKRRMMLGTLMNMYCNKLSVDINEYAFLFDGSLIEPEQTPDELGLEDGDEIDAMLHHIGGWSNGWM